jgi:acyl carrier protein
MSNLDRIRVLIAQTVRVPEERVTSDSSMDTLPEWDSVAHVNLMMSLEQEFDLLLEVEEFETLTSVRAIMERVAAHAG